MDRLDLGVAHGIISAEQRDALRALNAEVAAGPETEARRGLNAVTVAYWVGGIAVLSAFGWFLITRWTMLGPAGILAVAAVYAALFAVIARTLFRQGFKHAAAVATVLVVGMAPVIAWSLLSLAGLWSVNPDPKFPALELFDPAWSQLRWLQVDLATILAALIALRVVRFGVLALPIALGLAAAASHAVPLFFDYELLRGLGGRLPFLLALVLLTIGYALDVRQPRDEDYAVWFYLVAFGPLIGSIASFWSESPFFAAHGMLIAAAAFAVAAVRLHRRLFLLAAFLGFVSYLGYLAFHVFEKTLAFPIALATIGVIVILAAVGLQRRYPSLVRGTDSGGPRNIPEAPLALGGALLIALALIPAGLSDARQRIADQYWRESFERQRMHNIQKHGDRRAKPLPRPR